jgi:hypothetical protein
MLKKPTIGMRFGLGFGTVSMLALFIGGTAWQGMRAMDSNWQYFATV